MLPCKKRRASAVGSEDDGGYDDQGLSSDVQSSQTGASPPAGTDQLCSVVSPVEGQDDTIVNERRVSPSLPAVRPPSLPSPPLPPPEGDSPLLGMAVNETAEVVVSSGETGQKDYLEISKERPDLSSQRPEDQQGSKPSSSLDLLMDKTEQKLGWEASGVLPKAEAGWKVEDDSTDRKAVKSVQNAQKLHGSKEEADETGLFIPTEEREEGSKRKKRKAVKRKREGKPAQEEADEPLVCGLKLDDTLDRTLEDGAKQHNLTAVNVRNILHEVITNEHVVAMMKAAISETEDIPMFEPKMTRSKLKEVVEKGVVIPTWNISPIKKANEIKPPQFVDIPLEDDDSSDEEYQPEDEEEDEMTEESLMESDAESTSSSPRGAKRSRSSRSSDPVEAEDDAMAEKADTPPLPRHISAEVMPMGPPPAPKPKPSKDSAFMEKLHAVDEELAFSPMCMDSFQPLEDSLIAFRTRSKRPLKDVPLGQLEAELRAPDITPDMYDPNTADDEEWKSWLSGLMIDDVGNEDEADDDDDPEYNFLEDLDEPDTEDFRNDRAVRITKKEVNELMEELFETFQDEMGFSNVEDEGPEDDDSSAETRPNFNTPQVLRFEEPLANLLNEQHRTVKEQLEQLRLKKSAPKLPQESERAKLGNEKPVQVLTLDAGQRKRLMQQMQQHVQLLTQVHLLSSTNPSLCSEASTTRLFLTELHNFAQSAQLLCQLHGPTFQTAFQPWNLKGALQLLQDFHSGVKIEWSPRKAVKKNVSVFASLPKQLAWILATRKVFMYPELLPICSLKPKAPRDKIVFTKGEDNLLVLGLKHFEGIEFPKPLISKYLLTTRTAQQLAVRIKNLNMGKVPGNILIHYKTTKQLPPLPRLCEETHPGDWRPPIEQEEHRLPFWLKASLPFIQELVVQSSPEAPNCTDHLGKAREVPDETGREKYPLHMPEGLQWILRPLSSHFYPRARRHQHPAVAKPLPIRVGLCLPTVGGSSARKMAAKHVQPEAAPSKVGGRVPRLIQPAPLIQPLPGVQRLSLQPAVINQTDFELPGVFAPQHPGPRACVAAPMQQSLAPAIPVAFQPKTMLPTLPTLRSRKPRASRWPQKKKTLRPTPVLKPAPLLHPTPVIFIANSCNVLQPLAAATGAPMGNAGQPIPITTLLVNPAPFPCPLSQPLAVSTSPSLVVTSAGPLPSTAVGESQVVSQTVLRPVVCPIEVTSKMELEKPSSSPMSSAEEVGGPCPSDPNRGVQVETLLPAEERAVDVSLPDSSPLAEVGEIAMAGTREESRDLPREEPVAPSQEMVSRVSPVKEELVLGLGQELNVVPAPLYANEHKESPSKPSLAGEVQGLRPTGQGPTGADASVRELDVSPEGICRSGAVESGGCPAKPEVSPAAGGDGFTVSHEATREKEGPEEEEEEEFDDDAQDEEDEEMSSASEESMLSVPELQETMEKLTWLASERRLSPEGESEEENSQEENSEPEEEEEEEEEGEGENPESSQKEDEMADEVADPGDGPVECLTAASAVPEVKPSNVPAGGSTKAAPGKSRNSHRARAKRGRGRASKDTAKLLLLYDEDILERDPLREQKDLAFAQAYLSQVREALRHQPGKYEEFLRIIYEFEHNAEKQTAVDLYARLRRLLQEWPQLLTDFAAFLLPEQALECGLFEEQQAFEKSRKFLRQLEICFAENPSQHQKIVKVLQGCAECLPHQVMELKTQIWQLLKGHDHLQDEFSVFFDHLRPSAGRLGDFEEINWTEEKEYEFDGFEEVSLPEVEEEEDPPKIQPTSKSKRRKDLGGQTAEKEPEGTEGAKECPSCHETHSDLRVKRTKRRNCGHCSHKAGEGKTYRNKDPQDLNEAPSQRESSPRSEGKEPVEEGLEQREGGEDPPGTTRTAARRTEMAGAGEEGHGSHAEGRPSLSEASLEGAPLANGRSAEGVSLPGLPHPKAAGDATELLPADALASSAPQTLPELPQPKWDPCHKGLESDVRFGRREGDVSGLGKDVLEPGITAALGPGSPSAEKCPPKLVLRVVLAVEPGTPSEPHLQGKGVAAPPASRDVKPKGRERWGSQPKDSGLKETGANSPVRMGASESGTCSRHPLSGDSKATLESSTSEHFQGPEQPPPPTGDREHVAAPFRAEETHQRVTEAVVCAKNIKVSSTGEKVVLWTREADRVILTTCQERGAKRDTFCAISQQLQNKTAEEVSHRFRELMSLFHTACDVSSEDEDDGLSTSNTDQLSDKELVLSEEDPEEPGF